MRGDPHGTIQFVRRRILNVGAAVSLGVCVALVALAVRSCWVIDGVALGVGQSQYFVYSVAGEIGYFSEGHGATFHEMTCSRTEPDWDYLSGWKMVHFAFNPFPQMRSGPEQETPVAEVVFPNWTLALPLGCLARWFRRQARKLAPQSGFAVEPLAAQKP
jgi:hypothetical protein